MLWLYNRQDEAGYAVLAGGMALLRATYIGRDSKTRWVINGTRLITGVRWQKRQYTVSNSCSVCILRYTTAMHRSVKRWRCSVRWTKWCGQVCQKVYELPENVTDRETFYLNPIYSTKPYPERCPVIKADCFTNPSCW